jgi:hypothetical protein
MQQTVQWSPITPVRKLSIISERLKANLITVSIVEKAMLQAGFALLREHNAEA